MSASICRIWRRMPHGVQPKALITSPTRKETTMSLSATLSGESPRTRVMADIGCPSVRAADIRTVGDGFKAAVAPRWAWRKGKIAIGGNCRYAQSDRMADARARSYVGNVIVTRFVD